MCIYFTTSISVIFLLGLSSFKIVMPQCTSDTQPLTLTVTAFPLILTSPHYPYNYPPNQNCSWLLTTGDVNSKIIINLMDVQTDSLVNCDQNDHLVIYDESESTEKQNEIKCTLIFGTEYISIGRAETDDTDRDSSLSLRDMEIMAEMNSLFLDVIKSLRSVDQLVANTSAIVGTQLCEGNADNQVNAFVSTGNSLYVEFFSNGANEARGFRMLAFKNDSAYQPSSCAAEPQADSSIRVFMSPYLPATYDNNVQCVYNMNKSNPDAGIRLDIYFGDYEYSDGCNADLIAFVTLFPENLFWYCNGSQDNSFITLMYNSTSVQIEFSTNNLNNFYGFMFTYVEYTSGVNLFYPTDGQTISLTVSEDMESGFVDITTAYIEAFGSGNLTILPNRSSIPFGIAHPGGIRHFLFVNGTLDYEAASNYLITYQLTDDTDDSDVKTVNFDVTITDVDEFPPLIHNLPVTIDIPYSTAIGDTVFTVYANDSDGSNMYSAIVYDLTLNPGGVFTIDSVTGAVSLVLDPMAARLTNGIIMVTAYSYSTSSNLFTSGNITFSFSSNNSTDNGTTTTQTTRDPFTCWPNPRRVDVRMDDGAGKVLLTDLNCSTLVGVSYTITHQFPSNIFLFQYQQNGPYSLILNAPVYKIKFYTLRMNITDGTDTVALDFTVNVQTVKCTPEEINVGNMIKSGENFAHILCFLTMIFCIFLYQ